jgi:nucleotide-binding universal stress UspA family protein
MVAGVERLRQAWGRLAGGARSTPRELPAPPRRILLASTGVPFSPEVIARTIELATPGRATITVLSIARIWGTSLGLPHPGLQPTPMEWEEQRQIVNRASKALRRHGFEVRVQVAKARNAPKMIARWAVGIGAHAVVLADPERPRWRRVVEGDHARAIHRRSGVPVHAVTVPTRGPAQG